MRGKNLLLLINLESAFEWMDKVSTYPFRDTLFAKNVF
jgi:hypothetical protein